MRNHHQSCSTVLLQAAVMFPPLLVPWAGWFLQIPNCLASQKQLKKGRAQCSIHCWMSVIYLHGEEVASKWSPVPAFGWLAVLQPSTVLPLTFVQALCHAQWNTGLFFCRKKMSLSQVGIRYFAGEFSCISPGEILQENPICNCSQYKIKKFALEETMSSVVATTQHNLQDLRIQIDSAVSPCWAPGSSATCTQTF